MGPRDWSRRPLTRTRQRNRSPRPTISDGAGSVVLSRRDMQGRTEECGVGGQRACPPSDTTRGRVLEADFGEAHVERRCSVDDDLSAVRVPVTPSLRDCCRLSAPRSPAATRSRRAADGPAPGDPIAEYPNQPTGTSSPPRRVALSAPALTTPLSPGGSTKLGSESAHTLHWLLFGRRIRSDERARGMQAGCPVRRADQDMYS